MSNVRPISRLRRARLNLAKRKGYIRNTRAGQRTIMRISRPMFNSIKNPNRSYMYKYRISKGTVGIANGANSNYNGISFNLQDMPNYTELTSLYDEYCISKVVVEFHPRATPLSQAVSTATNGNVNQMQSNAQPFLTVIDYDDATPPGSRNDLIQYQTVKVSPAGTKVTRVFSPKIAVQTYKTALSSGYSAKSHQWLDCADDTIPHYGLKWAWNQDNAAPTDQILYDIYCTYYLKFRGVR